MYAYYCRFYQSSVFWRGVAFQEKYVVNWHALKLPKQRRHGGSSFVRTGKGR